MAGFFPKIQTVLDLVKQTIMGISNIQNISKRSL
jgi:hypothetical protein